MTKNRTRPIALFALAISCALAGGAGAAEIRWQHLSSARGELPPPGESRQQTGAVVGDFDGDGANDFILSFRQKAPALVWYRRGADSWKRVAIEKEYLTIEAGGAVEDIDGDGDPDIVFGGDWQSPQVWWWENPSPDFNPDVPWKRRSIKKDGKNQHHDQAFGDFLGTGRPQLAFWNQQAKAVFLAEIPDSPRAADGWPYAAIVSEASAGSTPYTEGMSAFDVDADGTLDILAYNFWLKHVKGKEFKAIRIADVGGLIFAGYFKPSRYPQVVISPGDGVGPLRIYECTGYPENPKDWTGRDLLDRSVVHGHSLQLGDVDGDGRLDIFAAEMAKWHEDQADPDNPKAAASIFFGDGAGNFRKTEIAAGQGWHEARMADLDGDGDLDILNKPYTWETPRVDVWLQGGTRKGARGVGTSGSFRGPVGLELYSLRDIFSKNVPYGLQLSRDFGFREVELGSTYGFAPEKFRAMLLNRGLMPIAALWDYDLFAKDPERIAAEARALGVRYAGLAWIPHEGSFTEGRAREAAAFFNRIGSLFARSGIRFFYHNHGYEFVPHGDGTLFDLLVKETDPKLVSFEMDVFWVVHPGQDPVSLLRKHGGRWELMHLKDMKKGVATGKLTGSEDVSADVVLGTGQIDLPAVLHEAQNAGVRHYFIEDESPAAAAQIPGSLRFLESLRW